MSDWKIFYRDEHSRDAQTSHPSKEAATSQAVHLVLHQKCRIQRIEGPNGEVIDRETFEREHLKKPGRPQEALLTPLPPPNEPPPASGLLWPLARFAGGPPGLHRRGERALRSDRHPAQAKKDLHPIESKATASARLPNKVNRDLKEAYLMAANLAGGKEGLIGYLKKQAELENPSAFMTGLSKLLPSMLEGNPDAPLIVERVYYTRDED